jgi:hypothetical protein
MGPALKNETVIIDLQPIMLHDTTGDVKVNLVGPCVYLLGV